MGDPNRRAGRHSLNIPGPSPIPDRILRAMAMPVIDHRGPEFGRMARRLFDDLTVVFRTARPVIVYPSSGTGAWEAALANALSPGDRVLMVETGHFASLWRAIAERLALVPEVIPTDWRHGADPAAIAERLAADRSHRIKAVCVVHNETSTGAVSPVAAIRKAIDSTGHPALYMVDTISSLASMDYRHDEWGVDVTVAASQKGLMLPPGLAFNVVSEKALAASRSATLPRSYFSWEEMLRHHGRGYFPYTPSTNLLFGLTEALAMLAEEGLDAVFARHARLATATRAAAEAWGLANLCADPACYSASLTAVMMPDGHDAEAFRAVALDHYDISLGAGLGRLGGRVFRIGHLGGVNEVAILGALAAIEMSLAVAGVPHREGGVDAAMRTLVRANGREQLAAAE